MGITKDQLVNTMTKMKTYTNNTLSDKIKAGTDFTSSSGFGNARVNDGNFQYYDESSTSWKDSADTVSSTKLNIYPQPMKNFVVDVDRTNKTFKLKWLEPDDTVIDNQLVCVVDKVIIVRKKDSFPESPTDGSVVITTNRGNFGKYKNTWYIDTDVAPSDGDTYYYKAFPYNNNGTYNNCSINEAKVQYAEYEVYGFTLDQSESDPDSMITYFGNNELYTPASMNFTTDIFNYGDWEDAWFIKNCKPCMLKYDGTVDYYLDPNDYTKKENGEDSDIADSSYEGNAMIEFPKVYLSVSTSDNVSTIKVSNKKLDDTYHCWAHIDANGNEMDYTYMSIYSGPVQSDKLRSLSGTNNSNSISFSGAISYAQMNNIDTNNIWNIETYGDRFVVTVLLLLISKTVDSRTAFGTGYFSGTTKVISTGTMNDKGLFWGDNGSNGVKVFGMENFWGNQHRWVTGLIIGDSTNPTQKVKMYKTDGDSDDYNLTGDGYHEIGEISGTSGSYVSNMYISQYGIQPKTLLGSKTTYYKTIYRNWTTTVGFAICGGPSSESTASLLHTEYINVDYTGWSICACLSCKPLAKTEEN